MVCASVWEDNPRALASGLSYVQTQNHTITYLFLLLQHTFALCALRNAFYLAFNIEILMKGAI